MRRARVVGGVVGVVERVIVWRRWEVAGSGVEGERVVEIFVWKVWRIGVRVAFGGGVGERSCLWRVRMEVWKVVIMACVWGSGLDAVQRVWGGGWEQGRVRVM